jgi:hypothetical protein
MPMRDGQNPNRVADRQTGDVVRKHLQIDSPVPAGPYAGSVGVPNNPADMLVLIVRNSVFELIGCLAQND